MRFEVEQKFRVNGFDQIETALRQRNAELSPSQTQVDHYLAHPQRNFAQTDEALRVRSAGPHNSLTYKGARIDQITKTRSELELPLLDGEQYREQFLTLFERLGFRRVTAVKKHRRKAFLTWNGARVEISLDEVPEVGTFVELELMAEESGVEPARQQLQSLAEALGLTESERRSYLDLLLLARGQSR